MYIHIPFCRQACSYCDFHFSVNHERMEEVVDAIITEIELRKNYLESNDDKPVLHTIYFGGGTPSLLNKSQLEKIFLQIEKYYTIASDAEITLEANPDDLTVEKLNELRQTPINRLSIGVQSFFEEDLKLMNRAHNAEMAKASIVAAAEAGFSNITMDLIYGVPEMSDDRWRKNLEQAFALPVNHLSCYSLTVEKRTALDKQIREGKIKPIEDERSISHFKILMDESQKQGFDHYEISNFGKPGFYSQHNSSYWKNIPYIGIGPSAHSYNGISRQWNISSNAAYVKAIQQHEIPAEIEILTLENKYNEYIMTGLRTQWGVNSDYILSAFGEKYHSDFLLQINEYVETEMVIKQNRDYILTRSGKLIADRIASKIFVV
ncbi:MAG TPA: radical SAM family heme chaperone HemW [Bacteroidia bacterium]|nr:radical SAM family heme chaperone HemW [Bacteroidia bacterium]